MEQRVLSAGEAGAAAITVVLIFAALYVVGLFIVLYQDYERSRLWKGGGTYASADNRSWTKFWRGEASPAHANTVGGNGSIAWKRPEGPLVIAPRIIGRRNKDGAHDDPDHQGREAATHAEGSAESFTTR